MKTKTIKIDAERVKRWDAILENGDSDRRDDVLDTISANFGDGYEVDIKLVNCRDESGYIDAVLFLDGHDSGCLEPAFDTVLGEYRFAHCGNEFCLIIEQE